MNKTQYNIVKVLCKVTDTSKVADRLNISVEETACVENSADYEGYWVNMKTGAATPDQQKIFDRLFRGKA